MRSPARNGPSPNPLAPDVDEVQKLPSLLDEVHRTPYASRKPRRARSMDGPFPSGWCRHRRAGFCHSGP
jgi:hypothetical protein